MIGRKIGDSITLKNGDQICVGLLLLTYRRAPEDLPAETEPSRLE